MAQPSRTFRIFVSSTFSDLKAERNALQEKVFPRLRDLAMAHGGRFQVIDLRWGVSDEASLDQQAMNPSVRLPTVPMTRMPFCKRSLRKTRRR
jgi:hypothetical protein